MSTPCRLFVPVIPCISLVAGYSFALMKLRGSLNESKYDQSIIYILIIMVIAICLVIWLFDRIIDTVEHELLEQHKGILLIMLRTNLPCRFLKDC